MLLSHRAYLPLDISYKIVLQAFNKKIQLLLWDSNKMSHYYFSLTNY
jgi:hypothetical protein